MLPELSLRLPAGYTHNAASRHTALIMKPLLPLVCLLLAALPLSGQSKGERVRAPSDDVPVNVLPVSVDGVEARSSMTLRDSLRQPFDEADNKPYRLSSQERQRLRDQLRGPSANDPIKK